MLVKCFEHLKVHAISVLMMIISDSILICKNNDHLRMLHVKLLIKSQLLQSIEKFANANQKFFKLCCREPNVPWK